MQTVRGRGDHVVVVGAGLAGLSAALHLAGRGRAVTVVERDAVPGGRVGRADIRGYRLDTEPTVLTMPYVIDDTLVDAVQDRLLPDLRDDAQVLHVVNPADWQRQGMLAGTPFSLAHTFAQTGPFRPANTVRGIDNAVLAGSSTVPGVGVPTALISGRLAADRITRQSAKSLNLKAGLP